ncbi:MAG: O-methyltransferase [Bacteroidota bacterium]
MKHPPYHLRINKAVDRLLLTDIVRASLYSSDKGLEEYTYYSLAGPFLQDLKVIDRFFPDMKLVSLEGNYQTYMRQEFHKFSAKLILENVPLRDFIIHKYEPSGIDIFWLDYTDLRYERFEEFQLLLDRVLPGSIIKLTLNAHPKDELFYLKEILSEAEVIPLKEKLERDFKDEFKGVLPHSHRDPFIGNNQKYARMIQLMVRRAASEALDKPGSDLDFLPLTSSRYNDRTQMLSVTGVVHRRKDLDETKEQFKDVRSVDFDWSEPIEINVPILSKKECFLLENELPVPQENEPGTILYEKLGYKIDRSVPLTKKRLDSYANYCREYPNFIRMTD